MAYTPEEKLKMFEQAILEKAQKKSQAILREAEETKKAELEREENKLLEELYHHIQSEVTEIKTTGVKEISRENVALKKQLYQQREQYLTEILARARAELVLFTRTKKYDAYLMAKAKSLAGTHQMEGSVIRVRSQDLSYADRIREAYGPCEVRADDASIQIGGLIFENREKGILVDYSLDAALEAQKSWLHNNSGFHID